MRAFRLAGQLGIPRRRPHFCSSRGQYHTRLRLEPLEDRRMLSVVGLDDAIEVLSTENALFAENAGQWTADEVYYSYNNDGTQIYFTNNSLLFSISRTVDNAQVKGDSPCDGLPDLLEQTELESTQFSLLFDNALSTVPTGADRAETVFNYHVGEEKNWVDGVATYTTVLYSGLYDNVDLYTYGRSGQMKYEFHVVPGADYQQIQLSYDGIEGLSICDDGSLHITTEFGDIVDENLYIYQMIDGCEVEVAGEFTLLDNDTYTFTITGSYDPTQELVIDPDLDWSTYLGGTSTDSIHDIAVDASGNIVVTGETNSSGWTGHPGNYDSFVVMLSATGSHLWSTYLGGSNPDYSRGIAIDSSGNILVAGYTTSSGWTYGGYDTEYDGSYDGFVAKLSANNGSHLWSTYLGGSSYDVAANIALDNQGNIYICGDTSSSAFGTSGVWDVSYNGGYDGFLVKLSASGTPIWSTYVGGNNYEYAWGLAVDNSSNVYVAGATTSTNWGIAGQYDISYGGGRDGYLVKFSSNGTHLWSTYVGGSSFDTIYNISTDNGANVYVCGMTQSNGWISNVGWDESLGGDEDGFLVKLSTNGNLLWDTYLGGTANDQGRDVVVDTSGNVFVTGSTSSSSWITDGYDTDFGGGHDAFVVKLDASGSPLWSTYLGGSADEWSYGIAMDTSDNVLVAGTTSSTDFPTTTGAWDTNYNGADDAFVVKFTTEDDFNSQVQDIWLSPSVTYQGETADVFARFKNLSSLFGPYGGYAEFDLRIIIYPPSGDGIYRCTSLEPSSGNSYEFAPAEVKNFYWDNYTFSEAGQYTIRAEIWQNNAYSDWSTSSSTRFDYYQETFTVEVLAHDPVATGVSPSNPVPVCLGTSQQFIVNASDLDNDLMAAEWQYMAPGGSWVEMPESYSMLSGGSDSASYTHTFSQAGTWQIKALVYDHRDVAGYYIWTVNVPSPEHPAMEFFDDFSYFGTQDPQFCDFGWQVRTASGGPGVEDAEWSEDCVSFLVEAASGQNIMRLAGRTQGTPETTEHSQVNTEERFFEGTYAARVRLSDSSVYGPNTDGIVEAPLFAINTLQYDYDPDYSELDFEYLPNDIWSSGTRSGPTMYCTTWETYQEDPWDPVRVYEPIEASYDGWHILLCQVEDGAVRYYIDGELIATHGGIYYPESDMSLMFQMWFDKDGLVSGGDAREWAINVDWVWHGANVSLTDAEVQHLVEDFRGNDILRQDTFIDPPSLSINDVTLTEGNSGTNTIDFTVSLSGANPNGVSVNYATLDGTASTADNDYVAKSGTLTWTPGDTSPKTICVTVNGDITFEPDEEFYINLIGATGATIERGQGIAQINNDDTQIRIPGDANNSYTVDAADAQIVANHWGLSGMQWADGDFNGDGWVNATDASIMAANWGSHLETGPDLVNPVEVVKDAPIIGPLPARRAVAARQPIVPIARGLEKNVPLAMGGLANESTSDLKSMPASKSRSVNESTPVGQCTPEATEAACDIVLAETTDHGARPRPIERAIDDRSPWAWSYSLARRNRPSHENKNVKIDPKAVELLIADDRR